MKIKQSYLILAIIVLILNLIWEFSHSFLYNDLTNIPKNLHLIIASFTDMIIIIIICYMISQINKSKQWIINPTKKDYVLLLILTISTSAIIEIINLKLKRWEYNQFMPTIFGIGISPLIQLLITSILGILILIYILKKH